MKRRTLMITIVILSLLLVAIPVNASTLVVDRAADRKDSPAVQTSSTNNLEDIINTLPDGFHESHFEGSQNQFSCFAVGWAADPDDRALDLNIRIFSDGGEVAQTVAGTFRQDLADAGVCQDGTCHFSVDLWGLISPDEDHVITVQAQDAQTGEWVDLSDTPRTLNCFEENILPEGYHDGLDGLQTQLSCIAEGWVTDPNDRHIDLTVRILSDGVEVAQTVADAFRQDLSDAGVCPDGTCSFSVNLASLISSDIDHSILVQAQDAQTGEWVDLYNTPKTLNCAGPRWHQINVNGFGDPTTNGVISLEIFRGQLYAGTANWNTGGQVWRWGRDGQWQPVSEAGFGSGPDNAAIIDLAVFQGKLYAGMGWNATPGQVWQSQDGTRWQPVTTDGFGNGENIAITNFTFFKDMFYAGTGSTTSSAQVWRSRTGNSGSWTQVGPDDSGLIGNVTGFAVYKDILYAAVEPAGGVGMPIQVWRSTNGSDWVTVTADGFGDPQNASTGGFAQFRGYLYLGIRNETTGGQIWRTKDGVDWQPVVGDGFGDLANIKVEALLVHDGLLYAVTFNEQSGMQVWRSVNGVSWELFSSGGFGHPNNSSSLWNNAILRYQGKIVVGTWNNFDGGELWTSIR
jgi:hypothetical protein